MFESLGRNSEEKEMIKVEMRGMFFETVKIILKAKQTNEEKTYISMR